VVALINAKIRPLRNKSQEKSDELTIDDTEGSESVETTEDFAYSFTITNTIRNYTIAVKTQEDFDQWVFMIHQDILRVIAPFVTPITIGVQPPSPETSSEEGSEPVSKPVTLYQQEKNLLSKYLAEHNGSKSGKAKKSSSDDASNIVDPVYRPNRVVLTEGLFEDEVAIVLTRPTQIEGAGASQTCINLKYPISVRSFNVMFKNLTIKLVGPPSSFKTADVEVSCAVSVYEQGNCYFEDCEVIYDASSAARGVSAGVLVGHKSQCYLQNTTIKGAQHGLVVAGESMALTQGGAVTSRSDCVKNVEKGETRMYDTAYYSMN
jgi:hypothetical protein